jgi:hypothetical protein
MLCGLGRGGGSDGLGGARTRLNGTMFCILRSSGSVLHPRQYRPEQRLQRPQKVAIVPLCLMKVPAWYSAKHCWISARVFIWRVQNG